MTARLVCGAVLWLVRPAYLIIELTVAARTTGAYSLLGDSVSKLGSVGCSATFCSPGHELMNGTFVGVGVLLAAGAVLLMPRIGPVATMLLVVAGLSSVATGMTPIDQDGALHAAAAAPLFVCQPIALLLLASRLRATHRRTSAALLGTGVGVGAAALGFLLVGDGPGSGLLERLALWPVLVAPAAAAWVVRR